MRDLEERLDIDFKKKIFLRNKTVIKRYNSAIFVLFVRKLCVYL